MAAEPATFWAMSWMTVKVVTTRNGFPACAEASCGAAHTKHAARAKAPRTVLTTMRHILPNTSKRGRRTSSGIYHARNRSQLENCKSFATGAVRPQPSIPKDHTKGKVSGAQKGSGAELTLRPL